MKRVIFKLFFLVAGCILLWGCSIEEEGVTFSTKQEEETGILNNDTVLDLGDHKVAYIVENGFISDVSGYELHIAIEDLEEGKTLYIPYPSYLIRKIQLIDDSFIEIECLDYGRIEKKRWQIPHGFFREEDTYFQYYALLLNSNGFNAPIVNEKIWEREIRLNGSVHTLIWERISQSYCNHNSIYEDDLADYLLTLLNEKGEVVCRQTVGSYPIRYEEVCWIKDISRDGNEDIIFCTYWENNEWAELFFLEWSDEKKFKISSLRESLCEPQWNEKQQALMFWVDSPYPYMVDMKMHRLQEGEWETYAELLTEVSEALPRRLDEEIVEEIFYKELDTHKREVFYEDGKIIQNEIVDASWFDEESIWYRDNSDNLKLFPRGWELEEVVLSTGEKVYKYVNIDL